MPDLTDDEIIDIRDRLVAIEDPTVLQQNWLRDCDIALRVVRCEDKTAAQARARVQRYQSDHDASLHRSRMSRATDRAQVK